MKDVSMMTPSRLHSILALPCLQSLTLRNVREFNTDDRETLTGQTFSVDELSVDGMHVTILWNFGLHTSCPRVQKLLLDWSAMENVSSDIVTMACSPFHDLTHLHIRGQMPFRASTLNDPVSFCDAVKTSCPRLTKLSLTNIVLTNKKAAEIIQLLKTHPNLTSIELKTCDTDMDLIH
ncbi:uncharacterized protein LOC115926667 [Strongylocentrotus purpuratus]|uniref:Uncharacterized protein n=1 Tax=Strongylocentrotus purpuratus TaxID=7668 RepID=A0A7M7T1S1_STRPU|nr:uncharacterized protein LOC115926667 [Strongylocentrotus purpuratus]